MNESYWKQRIDLTHDDEALIELWEEFEEYCQNNGWPDWWQKFRTRVDRAYENLGYVLALDGVWEDA